MKTLPYVAIIFVSLFAGCGKSDPQEDKENQPQEFDFGPGSDDGKYNQKPSK
jgi:hypothetical protein